jgi:hypothetical protein
MLFLFVIYHLIWMFHKSKIAKADYNDLAFNHP